MKQFIRIALYALVAAQFFALLAPLHWFFELWSHYQHYYLLLSLVFLCTHASLKHKKEALLSALVFILSAIPVLSSIQKNTTTQEQGLNIISSNFYYLNQEFEAFQTFIHEQNPDLFIVHEASSFWNQERKNFSKDYPHQALTQKLGPSGILIASKTPGNFKEHIFGNHPVLEFQTEEFSIYAVHPLPGMSPQMGQNFRLFFKEFSIHLDTVDTPYSIIGDFNATPWSATFRSFAFKNNLHNPSTVSTWHSSNPFFQLPIDHALLSPQLKSSPVETHHIKGSDHFAIETRLLIDSPQ